MKKSLVPAILFACLLPIAYCLLSSFVLHPSSFVYPASSVEKVQWHTWEEAVELNKTTPKKIIVDVYTGWCGWCKVMDKETFTNDTVANYLNKYFYCVKLDAEGKAPINFNGHKFEYVAQGKSGVHTLAYSLVDGQMSFPTIVFLNEKFERIMISPGYKNPKQIMPELTFTGESIYTKKSWDDYSKGR